MNCATLPVLKLFQSFTQIKSEIKHLNEKIQKYTKSIGQKQERIKVIESQLKSDADEVPLPIVQAEHDALTEVVSRLQLRADEMKERTGPLVGLIETLSMP